MSDKPFAVTLPSIQTPLLNTTDLSAAQIRRAAVHASDHIGAEHPHPLDDLMPKLAGRELAKDPVIAAGLLEVLDQLGIARGSK